MSLQTRIHFWVLGSRVRDLGRSAKFMIQRNKKNHVSLSNVEPMETVALALRIGRCIERLTTVVDVVDASLWYHGSCVPILKILETMSHERPMYGCGMCGRRAARRDTAVQFAQWLFDAMESNDQLRGHSKIAIRLVPTLDIPDCYRTDSSVAVTQSP